MGGGKREFSHPRIIMPINKAEKEQVVAELTQALKEAKGVVFADYRGLTVKEFQSLRRAMRQEGGNVKVAKLTLVKKAFEQAGLPMDESIHVPTAVVYSPEDEIAPAKVLVKFSTDAKKGAILSGILAGKVVTAADIKALAKLPGKQELRGQLVSVLVGPMRGMVYVLSGVQKSLLYALNARAEKLRAA